MGSNIFNVAAALGVTALVFPLPVHGNAVRLEWPVMFATSVWCLFMARDGSIGRIDGALSVAALVAFVAGGHLLVDGAVALARLAGMTERQIALTIVAGGTGAPELATSLVAAFRRRADVAVANMIGSNIFNVLGILGVTSLITPIPVSASIIQSDVWWMIGTAVLLLPVISTGRVIARLEGSALVVAYVAYVALLLRG